MTKPPIFEIYCRKLFINFRRKFFTNKTLDDKLIRGYNWNYIAFGLDGRAFDRIDFYYDGHTMKGFTFLYITLFYGYSYDWEYVE